MQHKSPRGKPGLLIDANCARVIDTSNLFIQDHMELRHLRYFEALAETLNFTRAAERVHVTQSTLSHQIRQLEEELGQPLFDRIGKRVSITEAGETLLLHIGPALRQVDMAVHAIRDVSEEIVGEIRVGTTQSFNLRLVPQCVSAFLARYPSVRVVIEELSASEVLARLRAGELDLGVSYRPAATNDLWFEELYTEEMVLAVGSNHPWFGRRKVRMAELHGMRLMLLPQQFSTRQMLDNCFATANASPLVTAELNSISAMLEIARTSDIAAFVGQSAAAPDDSIQFIPVEDPTPLRSPGLLWRRESPRISTVKYFAVMVRRATRQLGNK